MPHDANIELSASPPNAMSLDDANTHPCRHASSEYSKVRAAHDAPLINVSGINASDEYPKRAYLILTTLAIRNVKYPQHCPNLGLDHLDPGNHH